jgi:GAF domain-containing protein
MTTLKLRDGVHDPVTDDEAAHREDVMAHELLRLLTLSSTIASGAPLSSVLAEITRGAAEVIGARTASILLLNPSNTFDLVGSYGLSDSYGEFLQNPETVLRPGRGPAGIAVASSRPFAVEDVDREPAFESWRQVARKEGYRAMLSVPLAVEDGRSIGAITIYRDVTGPWSQQDIDLLCSFATHAASAVCIAQLVESQSRQVAALSRLVFTLREQTHEHANRLHAIGGLLALHEYEEASRFVAGLESAHHLSYGHLVGRVGNLALAGLIVAETSIAEQRGISLKLDARSNLSSLPPSLGDAEAVTVLGNLLQNALDAVADMPSPRRRVTLTLRSNPHETMFRVRDWGRGIADEQERLLERGYSTKSEHLGVGLALVAEIVEAVNGTLTVVREDRGTRATVTVSNA